MSSPAKFGANIRNSKRAMDDKLIQDGGRRHLKFTTFANFGHTTCFLYSWLHSCKMSLI